MEGKVVVLGLSRRWRDDEASRTKPAGNLGYHGDVFVLEPGVELGQGGLGQDGTSCCYEDVVFLV